MTETLPAPYSYPNIQSYPSFNDSTLPSVTTHQPAPTQYHPSPEVTPAAAAPPASQYAYDNSYQPAVEKIAEADRKSVV